CQIIPRAPTVDGITSTAETVAHVRAQRATHDSGLELHCKKRIAAADHQFRDFPLGHCPSEHRRLGDDFIGSRLNLNGLAHTADSEFDVHADTRCRAQLNSGLHKFFEARKLCGNCVMQSSQVCKNEVVRVVSCGMV